MFFKRHDQKFFKSSKCILSFSLWFFGCLFYHRLMDRIILPICVAVIQIFHVYRFKNINDR